MNFDPALDAGYPWETDNQPNENGALDESGAPF
jgi:hypothetical protein